MKSIFKRVISAIIAIALVVSMTPSIAEAKVVCPKKVTVYKYKDSDVSGTINISGGSIDENSVKSNASWLIKESWDRNISESGSYDSTVSSKKNSSKSSSIYFRVKKAGTAKFTYKVEGKTYTTKVVVKNKKYKSPIKSISCPTLNDGKDFSDIFNKDMYSKSVKVTDIKEHQYISIKTKNGYKVEFVQFNDAKNGKSIYTNYGRYIDFSKYGKKLPTSVNAYVGKLESGSKKYTYTRYNSLTIALYNKSEKVTYWFDINLE